WGPPPYLWNPAGQATNDPRCAKLQRSVFREGAACITPKKERARGQKKDPAGRHPAGSARPGRGTVHNSRSLVVFLFLHAYERGFERVGIELESGTFALDLVHAPPDPE